MKLNAIQMDLPNIGIARIRNDNPHAELSFIKQSESGTMDSKIKAYKCNNGKMQAEQHFTYYVDYVVNSKGHVASYIYDKNAKTWRLGSN